MNLHEYQAKQVLAEFGLPILDGHLAHTPDEAETAARELGGGICVVKAQVHAGGRGKAGGVKLAKNPAEAAAHAKEILGMKLVTPQTGAEGKLVRKVYVEGGCNIDKEYYLSVILDRENQQLAIVASAEGGMEIEEVAKETPEKIITIGVNPFIGFQNFQGVQLGEQLGLDVKITRKLSKLVATLCKVFVEKDLSQLEINPLVLTKESEFIILDAKVSVDDNALYRHTDLAGLRDEDEEDPKDVRASKAGLSYVAMDGNIGCMVNGAGLAMATMDIIKQYGGEPANFLDVGGGATTEAVKEAFSILLSDDKVEAILVNIFGGIMKCDVIAEGVVAAAKELGMEVPLVVRLQGTNVKLGREILAKSGLKITPADTMADAAEKAVAAAKE